MRYTKSFARILPAAALIAVAALSFPSASGADGIFRALMHAAPKAASFESGAAAPAFPPAGSFAPCRAVFPNATPPDLSTVPAGYKAMALCANRYAAIYSQAAKAPVLVVERLNASVLQQALNEKRTDQFYPDPRLPPRARAELDDFRGSGWDRGHLAPAGNQPDQAAMEQSFVLSNIVAQDRTNNREVWSKIESDVRKFARRAHGDVFVFTGPLFLGEIRTIGASGVWVPSHLFKLVFDESSHRAWAYILPNTSTARVTAPIPYADFVRQTGWNLLPRDVGTIAMR